MSRPRWWERRWAVYVPVNPEVGPSMRDEGHPVFEDAVGAWWGERVGQRYWTRRQAWQAAQLDDRSIRGMAAFAAAISGQLPRVAAPARTAWVGLADESGWYSRSSVMNAERAPDGHMPLWYWVVFAAVALVAPVGLLAVDMAVPAAGGWLLLAGGVVGVVVVALASVVLRRAPGARR